MSNKTQFFESYLNRIGTDFINTPNKKTNDDRAFEIFSISIVLNKSFNEVYDNIITFDKTNPGDQRDGGLDGVYFNENADSYDLYVFQCKNSPKLKTGELEKFRNDVREIFSEGNITDKPHANLLKRFIDEYKQITSEQKIINIQQFFLFNGSKGNTPNVASNQPDYEKFHNPTDGYFILDSDDLYSLMSNLTEKKRNPVKFTFKPIRSNIAPANDPQSLYTFYIANIKAANFRIEANELCRLMKEEIKVNGIVDLLFEENIRGYLGLKGKTNKKINETINKKDESELFPFFNNGITIICDKLEIPNKQDNSYFLPTTNPQIVNGLQTSRVLFENYNEEGNVLDNITVNVRIYEVQDPTIIDKITDATNTQTPINYRDKVSTKSYNQFTEIIFKNAGINFISKRSETFRKKNTKEESVESETVLQFWYATFYEKPEIAKNSIAKVMQEIYEASNEEDHLLHPLFDGERDSPIYNQLLAAYKIYRIIASRRSSEMERYQFVSHADQLIAYGIYKEIVPDFSLYTDKRISASYDSVISTISIIVTLEISEHVQQGRVSFSYSSYFKKSKCRDDYNRQRRIIDPENLIEKLKSLK